MNGRLRTMIAGAACVSTVLTLVACSSADPNDAPASAAELAHVHALSESDTGGLIVASHNGIYEVSTGEDGPEIAGPVGGVAFDSMGFVAAGETWYTSGHPGPSSPDEFAAPNLGLLKSGDRGESWTGVSLAGEADFHSLTAPPADPTRLYGIRTDSDRLQVSTDGGATWEAGAGLAARSLVADNNPDIVYATTEQGLAVSSDAGASFTVRQDAPPLFLLAADPSRGGGLVGIDTSGTVWEQEGNTEWVSGGTIDGVPQALTVTSDGSLVLALEHSILTSDDLGQTWSTIVEIG